MNIRGGRTPAARGPGRKKRLSGRRRSDAAESLRNTKNSTEPTEVTHGTSEHHRASRERRTAADDLQTTCRRPPDDLQTTSRRPADDLQTTSRRPPDDLQTTCRRPPDDLQTTCRRPPDDLQTTCRRPADDLQTTSRRPADDLQTTSGDPATSRCGVGFRFFPTCLGV